MYEIALSVNACVRSNTRADIAWMLPSLDSLVPMNFDALAITPGGGRIGSLLNSAFDGTFIEVATRKLQTGRIITKEISDFESSVTKIQAGVKLSFAMLPSNLLKPEIWQSFLDRESIAIVCYLNGDEIIKTEYFTNATILTAESEISEAFSKKKSMILSLGDRIVTIYHPVTKMVIAGQGPYAEALEKAANGLGWNVSVESLPNKFAGLTATLSQLDCAVIMGHDVESSSNCLRYALESKAGYIGALGSLKMQENRADWLAYRDVNDISRVHGPAGFDIGATSPEEIAISILAEAIAVLKGV